MLILIKYIVRVPGMRLEWIPKEVITGRVKLTDHYINNKVINNGINTVIIFTYTTHHLSIMRDRFKIN